MIKRLFIETLKLKTLLSKIKLLKFVILDGLVKENIQENHYVEHLHIYLHKLSKISYMTKKWMYGVWEC